MSRMIFFLVADICREWSGNLSVAFLVFTTRRQCAQFVSTTFFIEAANMDRHPKSEGGRGQGGTYISRLNASPRLYISFPQISMQCLMDIFFDCSICPFSITSNFGTVSSRLLSLFAHLLEGLVPRFKFLFNCVAEISHTCLVRKSLLS